MEANSKLEDYSYKELMDTLAWIKEEYPAVYRWFLIWELEKQHGPRTHSKGLGQEQEADSGQT